MSEARDRAAVVIEAMAWQRTPFIHGAAIKGIGADCSTFLAEVYRRAGIFEALQLPVTPDQWFVHENAKELYLDYLRRYATEYEIGPGGVPQPGDIVAVKSRWVYSHGAIVLKWPEVIHCHPPCVMRSDVYENPIFKRDLKFFNPFQKPEPTP